MAFAGGLQQTPRTKWLFSIVAICANRPIPRLVSVEGATGKVAILKSVVHLQEVCGQVAGARESQKSRQNSTKKAPASPILAIHNPLPCVVNPFKRAPPMRAFYDDVNDFFTGCRLVFSESDIIFTRVLFHLPNERSVASVLLPI